MQMQAVLTGTDLAPVRDLTGAMPGQLILAGRRRAPGIVPGLG